ncbi:tetratricopeptide repeat protein [Oceanobacter mangrovi]|uniref:tetratricopeptide repeat protein n=1 Tax=Oceanobacter mangrovi TaxID=2862510 RepID=UPI001C8E7151|nr:tetratricopeptide repeat protein [Oceanobacter mangrovi]
MRQPGKILQHLTLISLISVLASCVTVTEGGLQKNKDPQKAVENYTQLGYGYLQKDRPDMARNRLQKALAIDSDYAPANDAMGLVWQIEGEYDLAEEFLKKAVALDSSFTAAKHHLGRLYTQLKQYQQAEDWLNKAAGDRYYERRANAYSDLAMNFYLQGQPIKAIDSYKEALRLSPYNADALLNISTLLFEAQRYDDANKYFTRLDRMVQKGTTRHTANSAWLGIKLATIFQDTAQAVRLASILKDDYPNSTEYRLYQESLSGS